MAKKKASIKSLAHCEREHRKLAERLSRIGFIWPGSLSRRYLTCGNSECACQRDSKARHGPYIYWSTKKAGKTISRKLPPEEAHLLEGWIANRQEIKAIVDQMMAISQAAFGIIENMSDPKLRR